MARNSKKAPDFSCRVVCTERPQTGFKTVVVVCCCLLLGYPGVSHAAAVGWRLDSPRRSQGRRPGRDDARLGTGRRGRGRHLSVSRRRPPPAASPGLQPRATGCPGGRRGSEDREGRGAACPPRPLLGGHRAPFPHFLRVREVRRPPRCASDGFCTACVTAFLPVADTLPPCTRRVPPPSAEFFLQTPHWPPARPVCAFAQTSPSQEGLPCCSVRPAPPNILSASPSHSPHVLIIFTRY